MPPKTDLTSLLVDLVDEGIDFIVVGGMAAVIQGVPAATFDLDIVHSRTEENVNRILAFLDRMGAYARGRPEGQRLRPDGAALMVPGYQLMMTDRGALDLLGAIERGLTYEDLIVDSITLSLRGRPVLVVELEALLDLKRDATHPKDREKRLLIKETLRRKQGQASLKNGSDPGP
ncbi:MAG: hypothetical protein ABIK09_07735 [Pseudomonadota bacterium]